MIDKAAYIRREMIVSAVIGAALSAVIYLAVFGGSLPVPVWGKGGFAIDKVDQAFGIGLLAALVPGLLCRRAIKAGKVQPGAAGVPGIFSVIGKSILSAIGAAVLGGGALVALLWLGGWSSIAAMAALPITLVFGAILAPLVTRRFIDPMLG